MKAFDVLKPEVLLPVIAGVALIFFGGRAILRKIQAYKQAQQKRVAFRKNLSDLGQRYKGGYDGGGSDA